MVLALKEFGFDTPQLSEKLFLKEKNIVRMGIAPMRVEIFVGFLAIKTPDRFKKIDRGVLCVFSCGNVAQTLKSPGDFKVLRWPLSIPAKNRECRL